jgi:predicted aminopeptidase
MRRAAPRGVRHGPMLARLALLAALAAAMSGCSTLGYYWQAFDGQMELVRKARPVPDVIADPATAPELKDRLEQARQIRDFASRELRLPDNASYRRYADLKREYVVWNVFATDAFSIEARQWCFPVAGCVGYRGYFAQADAEAFAAELRRGEGDVYVAGVPAYSTLGWLSDPLLNTFIDYPRTELARLMFHELAHQVAYAPGDTVFNESFAVTVENEGVRRWLAAHGTPQERAAFESAQRRRDDFIALIAEYRARLARLYASGLAPAAMRVEKARAFEAMRADYAALKQRWGGYSGYDDWFAQPLNNAQIASVAFYTELVPAFERLLAASGGDLPRFYAQVAALAQLAQVQRREALGAETLGIIGRGPRHALEQPAAADAPLLD